MSNSGSAVTFSQQFLTLRPRRRDLFDRIVFDHRLEKGFGLGGGWGRFQGKDTSLVVKESGSLCGRSQFSIITTEATIIQ